MTTGLRLSPLVQLVLHRATRSPLGVFQPPRGVEKPKSILMMFRPFERRSFALLGVKSSRARHQILERSLSQLCVCLRSRSRSRYSHAAEVRLGL